MSDQLNDAGQETGQGDELDARKVPGNCCSSWWFGCNYFFRASGANGSLGTLSTAVDSDVYNMNHKHRGKCIIFNNREFDEHTKLSERRGTDTDATSLFLCLRELEFNVVVCHNCTKAKILSELKAVSLEDHTNYDCFVCVILTHGDNGILYGRDGKFRTDLIYEPFLGNNCPSLAGKPKLFFIQACQGDYLDDGAFLRTSHDGDEVVKIPARADFLVACSTVPGYYSWRNTTKGSWFIQALCDVLRRYGKEKELVEMLTIVNRYVAYGFESNTPDTPSMDRKKQIPCISSMLTRKVYFPAKSY